VSLFPQKFMHDINGVIGVVLYILVDITCCLLVFAKGGASWLCFVGCIKHPDFGGVIIPGTL